MRINGVCWKSYTLGLAQISSMFGSPGEVDTILHEIAVSRPVSPPDRKD